MIKKISAALLITVSMLLFIEGTFRVYDYGFKYRDLQKMLSEKRSDIPLPFEEIIVYLFKTGKCIRDPKLIWRYTPGANSPEMNSLGIRAPGGKEINHRKGDNAYRIMVLGGSHPFGLCLPYSQTYSFQLESLFEKDSRKWKKRVEVINAAVPGYSTAQVLNFLRYYMVYYGPDLVIIDAGNNDNISLTPDYQLRDKDAVRISAFTCRMLNFLDRSSFVWYYRKFLFKTAKKAEKKQSKDGHAFSPRVSEEENLRNLNEMKEIAAENHFGALFLSQMRLDDKGNLCRGFGAVVQPYLDIYALLKEKDDIPDYFIDTIHGSRKGHRFIAEAIHDYLVLNRYIEE